MALGQKYRLCKTKTRQRRRSDDGGIKIRIDIEKTV